MLSHKDAAGFIDNFSCLGEKKKDLTVTYKPPLVGVGAVDRVYINMYLKKTTPIGFRYPALIINDVFRSSL